MVIVAIDQTDLESVANGMNFISLLRTKYEKVRLNQVVKTDKKRVKTPRKTRKK